MPQKNKIKMVSASTMHFLTGVRAKVETCIPEKGDTTFTVTKVDEEDAETDESLELTVEGWEEVCSFIAGAIEQLEEAQEDDGKGDD